MVVLESEPRRAVRRSWPNSFSDRLTAPLASPRQMLKLAREVAPWRAGARYADVDRIPVRRDGLPAVPATATAVTWVGHATYVVQIGGLRVLTDPIWSRRIPTIRPRFVPPGVAWSELARVDAVVISHNHYDHLDWPTVRRLPRDTPVLVPAGLAGWFRRRGFTDVTDLDWWEAVEVGGVTFDFVPAHHWSRRTLTDTCRTLWGGWVLTAPTGRRVYFAGDTGYGHWFGEIAGRYPGIDVAMMPVGAYHPAWFMRPVHMGPEEAVLACDELGARHLAGMHWGTFAMTSEPVLEPLHRLRAAWQAAGHDRADLWDLAIGESRRLD